MIPLNFLPENETADYIITGAWGKKALKEAKKCGNANVIFSTAEEGFKSVPTQDELTFSEGANYIHYTSNETIEGVEFKSDYLFVIFYFFYLCNSWLIFLSVFLREILHKIN